MTYVSECGQTMRPGRLNGKLPPAMPTDYMPYKAGLQVISDLSPLQENRGDDDRGPGEQLGDS